MLKNKLRDKLIKKLLKIAANTASRHVHIGSCLSCFDIIFQILLYEMQPPDKFILSKGHAALSLYTILNYQKKIPDKIFNKYLTSGGYLGIHPTAAFPTDIPLPTGSLGHGLSYACGLTKGYLLKKSTPLPAVYCLMSDGECNEGTVWEAALFASKHRLFNLTVIIDKNNFQAFGRTKDVLGIAASGAKWKSFGFNVRECDGHNLSDLAKAVAGIKKIDNCRPNLIIANTVRGKGIKQIENKLDSNYLTVQNL